VVLQCGDEKGRRKNKFDSVEGLGSWRGRWVTAGTQKSGGGVTMETCLCKKSTQRKARIRLGNRGNKDIMGFAALLGY